jgi:hypothetical protein
MGGDVTFFLDVSDVFGAVRLLGAAENLETHH